MRGKCYQLSLLWRRLCPRPWGMLENLPWKACGRGRHLQTLSRNVPGLHPRGNLQRYLKASWGKAHSLARTKKHKIKTKGTREGTLFSQKGCAMTQTGLASTPSRNLIGFYPNIGVLCLPPIGWSPTPSLSQLASFKRISGKKKWKRWDKWLASLDHQVWGMWKRRGGSSSQTKASLSGEDEKIWIPLRKSFTRWARFKEYWPLTD